MWSADSGLGRATPPRRAASPGVRTLGSPASGPGSLPGAIGKRRQHHDDTSDVSSTHSSIMDYSGQSYYLYYTISYLILCRDANNVNVKSCFTFTLLMSIPTVTVYKI